MKIGKFRIDWSTQTGVSVYSRLIRVRFISEFLVKSMNAKNRIYESKSSAEGKGLFIRRLKSLDGI